MLTRVEVTVTDKLTSSLGYGIDYDCKIFYRIGPLSLISSTLPVKTMQCFFYSLRLHSRHRNFQWICSPAPVGERGNECYQLQLSVLITF